MSVTNQQLVKIFEFSIQEHQKVMEAHSGKMDDILKKLKSFELPNHSDFDTIQPDLTELNSIIQRHSNELFKSEKRLERKLKFPKLSIYVFIAGILMISLSIVLYSIQNRKSQIEEKYERHMTEMIKDFASFFAQNPDEFEKFQLWYDEKLSQENKKN